MSCGLRSGYEIYTFIYTTRSYTNSKLNSLFLNRTIHWFRFSSPGKKCPQMYEIIKRQLTYQKTSYFCNLIKKKINQLNCSCCYYRSLLLNYYCSNLNIKNTSHISIYWCACGDEIKYEMSLILLIPSVTRVD